MRAAALLVMSGCSFAFLDTPPRTPQRNVTPPCATSSGLPIADMLGFTTTFLGSFITLMAKSTDVFGCCDSLSRNEALGVSAGITVATVYGLSGVYGLHQTHRCRRFHALDPLSE